MPFGVVNGVGRGMGALNRGGDHSKGRDNFGDECWTSNCDHSGLCGVTLQKYTDQSSCSLG